MHAEQNLVLRPSHLLGGGLGVGRIVNAVVHRKKKVPNINQGLNFIGLQQPLFERNYILYTILLVVRLQLLVTVGEDEQLIFHV